jgi:hypothetical protein
MIARVGQLWDYRPAESMPWARLVVLKSDSAHVFPGMGVFHHRVMHCDSGRIGDL